MSIDRSANGHSHDGARPAVLLSIIAGLGMVIAVAGCRQDPPAPLPPALRLSLPLDELVTGIRPDYSIGLALAPDGRRIAIGGVTDGKAQLWLHDLATSVTTPVPQTTNATLPFWSPDGSALAYFAGGRLRAFRFADEHFDDLADAPTPRGGTWQPNGDIIFAPDDSGLKWRRASGAVEPFTTLEPSESSHRHPHVTADGGHVIVFVRATESMRHGIWIVPIDRPSDRRRLISSDGEGIPIERTLLYSSGGALVAQRVNADALALEGRPVLLGPSVGHSADHGLFAATSADILVFGTPPSAQRELQWVDRAGTRIGVLGEPMEAWDVRIAPRGTTVAVTRVDPQLNTLDVWAYDDRRPLPRRLSLNIDADEAPAWSRDANRIAWVGSRRIVTIRDARAAQPELPLRKLDNPVRVTDWSPSGAGNVGWIVMAATRRETQSDLVLIRPDAEGEVRTYLASPFNETHGVVSPDGRWMAYVSDESGRAEIYADAFPTPGGRARLTVGGGTEPRWSQSGGELFFRRGSEVHVVQLRVDAATVEATSSDRLFDAGGEIRSFDVTADGTRFLINVPAPDAAPRPLSVIVHVRSLLP